MVDRSGEPTASVTMPPGRAVAAVPAATIGANLLSYLLLLAAARVLTKADYGELLADLGVLLLGTVPALALQTVAARRTATRSRSARLGGTTLLVAAASGAAIALATPALQRFLHLDAPFGLLAVAAAVPATAILGTYQGINQGGRHFGRLAALIALTTGGRSAGGLIGVLVGRSPMWCLTGVASGVSLALLVTWRWLGTPDAAAGDSPDGMGTAHSARPGPIRDLVIEVAHAAHAHGAFLLLTSLDVLLARHVLDADAAGIYGVGSVVTRAALWLPQAVAMIMFASLTDHSRHRHAFGRAVAAVGAVALVTVAGSAGLGHLVVSVVGGGDYHVLDADIWLFAVLGGSLALTQLVMMAGLALSQRGRIVLVWANAAADVVAVLVAPPATPREAVQLLSSTSAVIAGACLLVGFTARARPSAPRHSLGYPTTLTDHRLSG